MNHKDLICHQDKENCPFKILDIQLDIYLCGFYDNYWREFNAGNTFGVKSLLNRSCEWIIKEEARLDFISKFARKETIKMLKSIDIGDILFWTTHSEEVKLFENPTEFSQIARCKCQRYNGKIVEIPAYLLCKISKGTYFGEFFIEGTESERKLEYLVYKVRYHGFRVVVEGKDNGFLLKIYGDSQQEVDDFINLFLEQNFDISSYI